MWVCDPGCLVGLVGVTAGSCVYEPWAAIICGMFSGLCYELGEWLLERAKVDDPVSAFPLHGMCGAWGLLFVGLLAKEDYISQVKCFCDTGQRTCLPGTGTPAAGNNTGRLG
jgi:ammonium transporter, Amt family